MTPMLTAVQKEGLLAIARGSIRSCLCGQESVFAPPEALPEASGVFVTIKIKRGGELRGCLGTLQLQGPLASEVARCAQDSAIRDPRFPPMTADELPEVRIEISVLGAPETIDPSDATTIEVGHHGLVVEQGTRRGLLLPQVAVEWGWTREEFLRRTCQKAGLPRDAWQRGAQVFRFTADVFGDSHGEG